MSHHLVTVCMFCLLCATHNTCGAHINTFSEDNDPSYTIVQFDGNTERPLPFHLKEDFREFERIEPINPYHDDEPKEHGIRKKNLAEEKKMRYLQKLSKIRNHRANTLEESSGVLELTHVKDDSVSDDAKSVVASDSKDIVAVDSDSKDIVSHAIDLKDILRNVSGLKDAVRADAGDFKRIVLYASDLKDIHASDLKDSAPDSGDLNDSVRIDTKQFKHVPRGVSENAISDIDKSDVLRKSDVDYSVNKRSIRDVKDKDSLRDFNSGTYVKRLISMYGDPNSMTMNVSGLNAMLRELDLMKMVEGGHVELRIPEYVYTNGHEEVTNHTCVSSAELIKKVNTRLNHSHHHEGSHHDHEEPLLNEASLQAICPIILYQKLANTSHERQGCIVDNLSAYKIAPSSDPKEAYTTRRLEVWVYSSLSIFVISACGILGVAVVPIMHKDYYNHIMQFLIALAIGTLGGDAFLHLIPHALSAGHSHGEGAEASHNDGMWKGLAAMMGVVFFYFTEKGLTVIAELRKRRQKLNKENKLPSRVRVMRDEGTSGCVKPISTSSTNSFLKIFNSKCKKQEDPDTKMCKHKYSEYPYCYDEITTDTHDHHHHRDGQIPPPSPKSGKILNNSVSVVSSNNLSEKESEPTAKDWLLNYMDDGDRSQKLGDSTPKDGVEMNNIKHKDGEVSKDPKDEESYTVILREHSRAHHGHSHSHGHVHAPPSSLSSVVWMVIMGDGLHNFTDGMAIGAAFASNIAVGFSTAIAVLCHELPHELGDFAVLLKAGMSVRRAIFYNVLSSVLCVAGMVCGVLVGHAPAATSWVFAVAAGLFIYIALADLVPELSSSHSKEGTFCQCMLQFLGLCTGIGIMLLIALYEHDLERLFG